MMRGLAYARKGDDDRAIADYDQASPPAAEPPLVQPEKIPSRTMPSPPELIAGRTISKTGSGFFVDQNGHIITNEHVVRDCAALTVMLPTAEVISAVTIAADPQLDLGVIQVPYDWPSSVRLAVTEVRLGDPVVVMGFPLQAILGTQLNLTNGSTSSLSGPNGDNRLFQISAPVQPGNSGGPVLSMSGSLVGVVVATLGSQELTDAIGVVPQNINFAIRKGHVEKFLSQNSVLVDYLDNHQRSVPEIGDIASKFTVAISQYLNSEARLW
jgi:S1-C subfamily serine protease